MPRADGPHAHDALARVVALRSRPARDATGRYYVEGLRQVFSALDAELPIDLLLYCEALAPTIAQRRVRLARRAGARVVRVTPEQFRCVSIAPRASGVGAIVRQHWSSIDDADPDAGLCWIAVGASRSAGNLGTLLRTAEAAGAGGIFGLRLVRAGHDELAAWAARNGCNVIGAAPRAAIRYTEAGVRQPIVVLFGEERGGLTERELRLCTQVVSIPMVGRADSLNLGVAAGIVLFDVLRRRSAS